MEDIELTSSGRFNISRFAKEKTKAAKVSINEGFNRIRTMTNENMNLLSSTELSQSKSLRLDIIFTAIRLWL